MSDREKKKGRNRNAVPGDGFLSSTTARLYRRCAAMARPNMAPVRAPSLTSATSIILIVILPALDVVKMAYIYTAVPLHFVDQKWPLGDLGILFSVCYLPRFLVTIAISTWGEWLCVPVLFCGLAASIVMVISPLSLPAVALGCLGCSAAVMNQANRGLVFRRFGHDDDQQRRAMRIFTFFDVTGYSAGAMLGGLIYDQGTFVACSYFQLSVVLIQFVFSLSLPTVWQAMREVCCSKTAKGVANHAAASISTPFTAPVVTVDAVECMADLQTPKAKEVCYKAKEEAERPMKEIATDKAPASIRGAGLLWPASVVFGVTFVNLFVYGT